MKLIDTILPILLILLIIFMFTGFPYMVISGKQRIKKQINECQNLSGVYIRNSRSSDTCFQSGLLIKVYSNQW